MPSNCNAGLAERVHAMPAPRSFAIVADEVASPKRRILIIEDHFNLASLVRQHLEQEGFEVVVANDGNSGYLLAAVEAFDLVVLDRSLPGIDGLSICAKLRNKKVNSRILMLSAHHTEADRVAGLDAGADDYVSKPFGMSELLARVRAQLRRTNPRSDASTAPEAGTVLSYGELRIEEDKRKVIVAGNAVTLTATEFDLLWVLARNPGRVFSRSQLLDQVWGHEYSGFENTVKSHINRLRSKIERDPACPTYVITVWGVGYCFRSEHPG